MSPARSLAQYQEDRSALRGAQARKAVRPSRCRECGAQVLVSHVDGMVPLAVDPRPLVGPLEGWALAHGRLVVCLRWGLSYLPDRMYFRSRAHTGSDRCRQEHDLVAEHVCPDRRGQWRVTPYDHFGSQPPMPGKTRSEPVNPDDPDAPVVKNHRYWAVNPETGTKQYFQRVSTFAKTLTDEYSLRQWQIRCAMKGMAGDVEMIEKVQQYHVRNDKDTFDELADEAKRAAGAYDAANTGTALHTAAEMLDLHGTFARVREEHRELTAAYGKLIDQARIKPIREYIESRIVCPEYGVAGRLDRVYELPDGSWAIGDLKTGATLDYAKNEIPVQLRCYARGFNAHGIWVPGQGWVRQPRVREDIAIAIHVPANGTTPDIYITDIGGAGKELARLCLETRENRKRKDGMRLYAGVWPAQPTEEANAQAWDERIREAATVEDLVAVSKDLRNMGAWSPQYAASCRARRDELTEREET